MNRRLALFALLALSTSGCLLSFDDPSCDPSAHPSTCTDGAVCDPIQRICVQPASGSSSSSGHSGASTSTGGSTSTSSSATSGTTGTSSSSSTLSTSSSTGTTSTSSTSTSSSTTGTTTGTTSSSTTTGTSGTTGTARALFGQVAIGDLQSGLDPSGALVAVLSPDGGFLHRDDGGLVWTNTDSAGNYVLDGIPLGNYRLVFAAAVDAGALGQLGYGVVLDDVTFGALGVEVNRVLGEGYDAGLPNPLVLPAVNQRIASPNSTCIFNVNEADGGDLYVMNVSQLDRLRMGTVTPLASEVFGSAYAVLDDTLATITDAGAGTCALALTNLDGGSVLPAQSTSCLDAPPVLSPDHNLVAYWNNCIYSSSVQNCDLELLPLAGGFPARSLGTTSVNFDYGASVVGAPYAQFTPDSQYLLYVAGGNSSTIYIDGSLTLAKLDGGPGHATEVLATNVVELAYDGRLPPQLSPDGTYLAYMVDGNFPDCHVVSVADGWAAIDAGLSPGGIEIYDCSRFVFSPDSQFVALDSSYGAELNLYASATGARMVATEALRGGAYGFSPDSRRLYFDDDAGLEVWDIDAGPFDDGGKPITTLMPGADKFVLSPDGQWAAVWLNPQSVGVPDSLSVLPTSGGASVAITDPILQTTDVTGVLFAPDSQHLAFVEGPTLYLATISDGGTTPVGTSVSPVDTTPGSYAFTRDGATLAFIEQRDGGSVLKAVDVLGGPAIPLNADVRAPLRVGPSGLDSVRCTLSTPAWYLNGLYETPLP